MITETYRKHQNVFNHFLCFELRKYNKIKIIILNVKIEIDLPTLRPKNLNLQLIFIYFVLSIAQLNQNQHH